MSYLPCLLTGLGGLAVGYFASNYMRTGKFVGTLPHWSYNYGPDRIQWGTQSPLVIGKSGTGTLPHWAYNYGPDRIQWGTQSPLVIGKRRFSR